MEENIDKQDRVIATEGSDIEIDKDGGSGTTLHGVVEEREEEENASEKEDEVDEEEEGEEKEDGGYTFRFENGMNPLDFFDSGVQCYQQLQQHEEEALANKKQKSPECPISECNKGNSFKKAREDDISEEKWAEVMEAMNIGGHRRSRKRKQPKKRGRRKGSKKKLDERLSQMLGDANLHYSNCSFDKAIAVLHEVVRLEPNLPDSYHILGLVHKELGDYKKEMEFYMIAAILTPKYSSIGQKVEDLLADPENEKWLSISSEFCGGTHISNTRDAKAFALLAEEGIAKGIRRVTAVTTDRAYDAIKMADEFEQQVDDASKLEGSLLEEKVSSLKSNVETLSIPAAKKAEIKTKIALLQDQVRKAQKRVAEENKRKAVTLTVERADLAASDGKTFCISHVNVGLDVAAVREAVTKVIDHKGLSVMVFSTDESTNKAVVCAGVPEKGDKGKLDVSEWLSNALGPLKGRCGKGKGGLATGQGTDASHVNEAMDLAAKFASIKLT